MTISVTVSGGTYIRGLARDIGDVLRCGAICTSIRRTAVGSLSLDAAVSLSEVTLAQGLRLADVLDFPSVYVEEADVKHIVHFGKKWRPGYRTRCASRHMRPGQCRLLTPSGDLVGVGCVDTDGRLSVEMHLLDAPGVGRHVTPPAVGAQRS